MSLLDGLNTEDKSSLVNAINEILGKQLITESIGEPLNGSDTFKAMSEDINGLLNTFKTNMMNAGVVVESGDKFKQLIDKIKGLTEGEGNKGIKYASGNFTGFLQDYITGGTVTYNIDCDFVPTVLFIKVASAMVDSYSTPRNVFISNLAPFEINPDPRVYSGTAQAYSLNAEIINLTNSSFDLHIIEGGMCETIMQFTEYYAIGVGEEDTTLRDSLASILKDEGVNVTEEDDMASLINKTDNEFQENTTILYNKMKNANYNVNSSMNMDALLNELTFKTMIEGSVAQSPSINGNALVYSVNGLEFTPSLVYVTLGGVLEQNDVMESVYYNSIVVNNRNPFVGTSEYNTIEVSIKNNGFDLILNAQMGGTYTGLGWTSINWISYIAIR